MVVVQVSDIPAYAHVTAQAYVAEIGVRGTVPQSTHQDRAVQINIIAGKGEKVLSLSMYVHTYNSGEVALFLCHLGNCRTWEDSLNKRLCKEFNKGFFNIIGMRKGGGRPWPTHFFSQGPICSPTS